MWRKVAIQGVGLIGGSIGLALRQRNLAEEVIGIGRNTEKLAHAQTLGAITQFSTDLAEAAADVDLLVVCTPVDLIGKHVVDAAKWMRSDAIITDAGSTKAELVATIDVKLQEEQKHAKQDMPSFVGSHPMAGKETAGCEHADGDLFVDRMVVITPSENSQPEAINQVASFWQAIGATTVSMTPQEHDEAVAIVSHAPHLIAAALRTLPSAEQLNIASTGWQDTTRIGEMNREIWLPIIAANRAAIVDSLKRYSSRLKTITLAIEDEDDAMLAGLLAIASANNKIEEEPDEKESS